MNTIPTHWNQNKIYYKIETIGIIPILNIFWQNIFMFSLSTDHFELMVSTLLRMRHVCSNHGFILIICLFIHLDPKNVNYLNCTFFF